MPRWLKGLLPPLTVVLLSFITYFWEYWEPPYFFWDENYHVAHAQKYLNGIYFMEPHPPLGKLLIAAGELLLDGNLSDDQFINTDYAKDLPKGFSFVGYRFFPALLAWLAAPLLYFTLVLITNNRLWGMLLSFLYIFDNALIVHSRGAMLEGPQIFFVILSFLFFFMLVKRRPGLNLNALILGLSVGAAVSIKLNALVLLLLFGFLIWELRDDFAAILKINFNAALGFCLVFFGVWYVHFWLGRTVNPGLPDKGYYQASAEYKDLLRLERTGDVAKFPVMLRDSLKFVGHYEKGVPKLNLCNNGENGSPAWLWPVGARTINYRWEKDGPLTKYLFLQGNPIVWFGVLAGVIMAGGIIIAAIFFPLGNQGPREFGALSAFSAMYAAYMLVMVALERVMYLYHYFLPLIFGIILIALIIVEVRKFGPLELSENFKGVLLAVLAAMTVSAYGYFSPLTYYKPLLDSTLIRMAWLDIWDLRCPSCPNTNHLARSTCNPKEKQFPEAAISGLRAEIAFQDWGEPRLNRSVEGHEIVINGIKYPQGIGVHANSTIRYRLKKKYQTLSGAAGLPDYLKSKSGSPARVNFEIFGDGRSLWRSNLIAAGAEPESFAVSVSDIELLELAVRDGDNGIDNDHGCWLNLALK